MAENSASQPGQFVSLAEFQKLKQQLESLLKKQNDPAKTISTRVHIEKDPPPDFGNPIKATKLPEYHGKRVTYPAWRAAVLDIFRIDWNLFGYDSPRAFLMIFGALKGEAAEKSGTFY